MNGIETVPDGLLATAVVFGFIGIMSAFWGAMADNYGGHPEAFKMGLRVGLTLGSLASMSLLAAIWVEVLA